jgi:excisionase family DNA binding protein
MLSRHATRNRYIDGHAQPLERLLTVDQLAELWQISSRTIRRMIADGRLPVVRLGRAVRIPAKVAARLNRKALKCVSAQSQ